MDNWTPVKTKYPPVNKFVLGYCPSIKNNNTHNDTYIMAYIGLGQWSILMGGVVERVEYWMEIPSKPGT